MTERWRDALEAAVLASLIGGVTAFAIVFFVDEAHNNARTPTPLQIATIGAGLPTFALTLAFWYWTFPRRDVSVTHALWLGPVIVTFALWGMFVVWGLTTTSLYVNEGILGAIAASFSIGFVFAVFGLVMVGTVILPVGAIAAFAIRRQQIRRAKPPSSA